MLKELLKDFDDIQKEIKDLEERLKKINKTENIVTSDSVQGSSKYFPYTKHNIKISGIKIPKNRNLKSKYRKMIESKSYKLDKMRLQIEYELNYIEDSEIREIIRHKYNDNMNWKQVMRKMKYNSEDTARKKLQRFLKKY